MDNERHAIETQDLTRQMNKQKPYKPAERPLLAELKSRPCSFEELQAALLHLIELHNKQGELMEAAINRKQDRPWRATI